jgi:hypothetical protein
MPVLHPQGVSLSGLILDAGCLIFIGGVLLKVFVNSLANYPPYPQRDPRMAEALGLEVPPTTDIAAAPERAK